MVNRDGVRRAWRVVRDAASDSRVAGVARDVKYKVRDAKYSAATRVGRGRDGMSDNDIWDLGPSLLHRLPEWLRRYAHMTHGYPYGYDENTDLWLVKHDDSWADESCDPTLFGFDDSMGRKRLRDVVSEALDEIRRDGDDNMETDGDTDDAHGGNVTDIIDGEHPYMKQSTNGKNLLTFKTNRDMDLGYMAWVTDLNHAADVIEAYDKWMNDILYTDNIVALHGREEADKLEADIREQFTEVWAWLGRTLPSLWI